MPGALHKSGGQGRPWQVRKPWPGSMKVQEEEQEENYTILHNIMDLKEEGVKPQLLPL